MSVPPAPTPIVPRNADPRLRPAPQRGVNLTTLILAGTLSAACFGSRVVLQEIQSAPDMVGYSHLNNTGLAWDRIMRDLRATAPGAMLHGAVRWAEAARF